MRYPQFIGVGAQKAGTTWLHRTLGRHRDAWLPPVKELHYFDRIGPGAGTDAAVDTLTRKRTEAVLRTMESVLKSGLANEGKIGRIHCLSVIGASRLTDEWYARIFNFAPAAATCGEITPEYALLPDSSFEHMLRLQPLAKFIFMMRDPIDRSWSALRMLEREGRLESDSFAQHLSREGFIAYSDYTATVARLMAHVEPDRVLLLYYDDLLRAAGEVAERVFAFLDLDTRRGDLQGVDKPAHAGPERDMPAAVYQALKISLRPIYDRLRSSLDSPVPRLWYEKHYG